MFVIDKNALHQGAKHFKIELTDRQLDQFQSFADLLLEWNKNINLTRIPPEDFVAQHFLDSLSLNLAVPFDQIENLLDVGTGAGFPGVPLKIAFPNLKVTLLDSTRKRLNFIQHAITELSLYEVSTLHARAEQAAKLPEHRRQYQGVTARAVAKLDDLIKLTLPLARPKGIVIASKSKKAESEIEDALPTIKELGGKLREIKKVDIPGAELTRVLVVIEKN